MAIKVNGTTVINDSRALSNIASVDATTAAAIGAAGVGGGQEWTLLSTYTNSNTYEQGTSFEIGDITVNMPSDMSSISGLAFVVEKDHRKSTSYGAGQYLFFGKQGLTGSARWSTADQHRWTWGHYDGAQFSDWRSVVSTLYIPITFIPYAYDARNHSSTGYIRPVITFDSSNVTTRYNTSWNGDYTGDTLGISPGYGDADLFSNSLQAGETWKYHISKDSTDGIRNITIKVWGMIG
jgi:hypothetical protein